MKADLLLNENRVCIVLGILHVVENATAQFTCLHDLTWCYQLHEWSEMRCIRYYECFVASPLCNVLVLIYMKMYSGITYSNSFMWLTCFYI